MNDDQRITPLEQSMSSMRPKAMPADLLADLVNEMAHDDRRQRWSDRLLLTAMSSGVAAAFVIVAMLLPQSTAGTPASSPSPVIAVGQPQRVGDYLVLFARTDGIVIK